MFEIRLSAEEVAAVFNQPGSVVVVGPDGREVGVVETRGRIPPWVDIDALEAELTKKERSHHAGSEGLTTDEVIQQLRASVSGGGQPSCPGS